MKILLLLMFTIELFASWNVDPSVNIIKDHSSKIKDGIGKSGLIINSEETKLNRMRFDGYSKTTNRYDSNYIAHVSATIDDVSVFDAALSPYLAWNPLFKFGFKDFTDSDDITYVLTDNHGEKIQQTFKINRIDSLKNQKATIEQKRVKPIILNPKAWEAVTVESAIESVFPHYASRKKEETETRFSPDLKEAFVDVRVPMGVLIKSKIKLNRIAIFSTAMPKPLLAFIQVPDNGFVDIGMRFKLDKSGEMFFTEELFIIGEGEDNKLYRSETRKLLGVYSETSDSYNGFGVEINLENKSKK